MAVKKQQRLGIQSVEVAAQVLQAFINAGQPMQLKDIARLAHMHPGKIHRYLVSLARTGLVEQNEESGHYGLGAMAITLGLAGLRNVSVVGSGADALRQLRDKTAETALLALWSSGGPVVVNLEESARPVYMNIRVGSLLPILKTASGRVFAAHLPEGQSRELIDAEREANGKSDSLHAWSAISQLLADTRKRGLARVTGDLLLGVNAIAAPVFDHKGRIAAVIGVLGRSQELNVDYGGATAKTLLTIASDLSKRLGHQLKK